MPPPRKKAKLEAMRCPNNPVSFEQFKHLIENLPDISFEVQRDGVAGKDATLDECAFWYYESFYRYPEVRQKYPYKLRACPMRIRVKLLSMPESEPEVDPAAEHQVGKGVMVKVARMGTFIFPVTFFAFKSYVDAEKVFRMIGMTKEERKAMLADEIQCEVILKKFYNSFYMFPDRLSTDIFKSIPSQFLEVLCKHGEPYDELAKKSVEKYAAGKKRQHTVVSFKEFEKYLANMFDIVWQLKLHNRDYAALDFEKGARALYLDFYLKPEIRDKYKFKWRPCSLAMQKRLLKIPNEESAVEMRKSFPHLFPDSPIEEETIEVDNESPVLVIEEPISAADDLKSLENNNNNNNNSDGKLLNQPAKQNTPPKEGDALKGHVTSSEELPKLVLEESSEGSQEELFQTDVEVDIGKSGRFMFPVSFDTFRRCINYGEIIRPILTLALNDKTQLEHLIRHPHNPICEKIFLRYYRSFYIFPDTRQKCEYRFSCRNYQVFKKLTEYAKPLNESAIKTINDSKTKSQEATNAVPVEQSKSNRAEEAEIATVLAQEGHQIRECIENAKEQEIRENIERGLKEKPNFPVTFHVFKRYVTNLNQILQQMKLCDEYKEKSDTECAEEYYKGFYTSPEVRNKFECILRPCPAKMRDVLFSYAKQPEVVDSLQESNCVGLEDVLPMATTLSEKPKAIPVKESKVEDTHKNHVSFHLFKRYISNLKEIVQQMLPCDEYRGKSEEECARDYYNGFYSSQEVRDRFPYHLKPCPAKMRNKLISFPTKENVLAEKHPDICDTIPDICDTIPEKLKENILKQTDEVEVNSSEIPVQTEEFLSQIQTFNHNEQTAAILGQKSGNTSSNISKQTTVRTLKNGASFEYPVSFETFKRHINYDVIVKSLLLEDAQNENDQIKRGKMLFRNFFCSFYVQKDFRKRYPYRFNKAGKELLKKLEEYAVPLNDLARQIMSNPAQDKAPQIEGNEVESRMVPHAPKDETLVTISGIAYCFPVSFETFHKYINYEELKEGLANGPTLKKKSPVELSKILGDETRCMRLLRSYYHSFYTMKNIRNKLNYNFNAAPPELSQKLLEWAKPIDESTETAQPKQGSPSAPHIVPVQHKEDVSPEKLSELCEPNCSSSETSKENSLITEADEVEVCSNEIPVQTEEFLTQNQATNNSKQTVATLGHKLRKTSPNISKQKTIKTLKSGASFEFPVSFETFKRHINYDEIVKSLLLEDVQNKNDHQIKRVKMLFRHFFCSFYIQKDFRKRYPYRFHKADEELLKKLEEYAVPLNDVAKQTMSDQAQGKAPQKEGSENDSSMVPRAPKDETLVTISGIAYRFPVSFETFHRYINFEEIKEGLANGGGLKKKSPEQLAEILEDEMSCLRLLRSYYHSFYTMKNLRNKLNYNFNAAPPELSEKLLEWAKPIEESTNPTQSLSQTLPQAQTKQGATNAPAQGPTEAPVTLNVFLNYMHLDDVVTGMQKEPEYSTMTEDECKFQYYKAFYTDVRIRDKYPFKLKPCSAEIRKRLLMLSPTSDHTYHMDYRDLDEMNATRERELAGKQKINFCTYRPRSLRLYIACHISMPEKQALLERHILDSKTIKENKTVSETIMREDISMRGKDAATREEDTSTREKENGMRKETTREEATREVATREEATREEATREETTREEATGEEATREEATREETAREEATREEATRKETTREETTREGATREGAAAREATTSQGKTTASKEATTTRKEETISKKNTEAKSTNKPPPVPKKVIKNNSPKENELQKSSEVVSVSENISKTSSKENQRENAPTKPPEEVSLSDSTKKPQSSSDKVSKELEETQEKEDTSQDATDSTAASNVSHQQTERQIILDQAKKVFFADCSQDHNMAYLICTSQGLKTAIWRILHQLTLEEFKTYTSIHNGEELYKKDTDLQPYYQHVVDKGNWPINLYVRLPLLRQLLHSKGVEIGRLDLGQLSPKILHWREADEHTNFDQIVERQFKDRTGEEIDSVEQWFEEREWFYAACWLHDQWIYEVPQITNDALHDESYIKDLPLPDLTGIVLKSLPIASREDVSSQTEIISIASSSDMVPDSQSCPSTQLSAASNLVDITTMNSSSSLHDKSCNIGIVFSSSESFSNEEREAGSSQTDLVPDSQNCPPTQLSHASNFVDIANVDIQSQVPETPLDPLATQAETMSSVKQEPIKFLNNLRGVCDTDGCQWEHIGTEEQIVNLDCSQDEGPSLSCFAIQKPSETMSRYQSLDSLLTATMFEDDSIVVLEEGDLPEHEEAAVTPEPCPDVNVNQLPEEPAVVPAPSSEASEVNVIQSQVINLPKPPEARKKKISASKAMPSKRPRLVNDKVPQLRHEFRPLPMGACIRIETEVLGTHKSPTKTPQIIPTPQPEEVVVPSNMTPSQEFAQGNTLLESSQLAALLDALPPGLTVRKVNEKEQVISGNLAKVTVPEPTLWERGIFRKLERFNFFASLTVQHIIKHRIEGYLAGATYQSALLKIDGKLSQVRGPLLNVLFPHLSPQMLSDLERVLLDLPEFVYNCRWRRVQEDSTEDLRKRVLFTFMDMAPGFGQFRLQFDNASREWATCSEIGRWDESERAEPRPRSLENVISPEILDKMREFKTNVLNIIETWEK